MNSSPASKQVSEVHVEGFENVLETKEAGANFIVYRAHGETSHMIGRFFFTPQANGTPMQNWTADALEMELNAALWGNDFRYLAKFRVYSHVICKIGPIAHDNYRGFEDLRQRDKPFDQYSYFKNAGRFLQVKIDGITDLNWRDYVELLQDEPIKGGRFHRKFGNC